MLWQLAEIPFTQLDSYYTGIDSGCVDGNSLLSLDDAQQFLRKTLDVIGKRIEVINKLNQARLAQQSQRVFPYAAQAAILQKLYLLSLRHFLNYTTEPTFKTKKGRSQETLRAALAQILGPKK